MKVYERTERRKCLATNVLFWYTAEADLRTSDTASDRPVIQPVSDRLISNRNSVTESWQSKEWEQWEHYKAM